MITLAVMFIALCATVSIAVWRLAKAGGNVEFKVSVGWGKRNEPDA